MKLLVCGSRNMPPDKSVLVRNEIAKLSPDCLVSGGAMGADTWAENAARGLVIPITIYFADWKRYGARAGYLRNKQMLEDGKPDKVLAFYPKSGITKGTKMMVELAEAANVEVIEVQYDD